MPMSVHAPPPPVTLAIAGTEARFAVRRIYCIGRNYVEHVREIDRRRGEAHTADAGEVERAPRR